MRNLSSERQQQEQLYVAACKIEEFLKEQKVDYILLVSPANLTFDEIPSCYQKQKAWERFTHTLDKVHVWYFWEYEKEKPIEHKVDIWKWMEELVDPVSRQWKLELALEKLCRYRNTIPVDTYLHIAGLLYQELLAKRKKLNLCTYDLEERTNIFFRILTH